MDEMPPPPERLTFRHLDGNVETEPPRCALQVWYEAVRDIPLSEMEVRDLARAARQRLYPEEIVPLCMRKLEEDPLAGELYDGELILSLRDVGKACWLEHPDQRMRFLELAEIGCLEAIDQELSGAEKLMITEDDLLQR